MYGDWKLTYEGTEYAFGPAHHPVELIEWEQGPDVYAVDDASSDRDDGVWFGEDYIEPGEISISVKIDFTDAPFPVEECARLAMVARSELARVWRADPVRRRAGALAELHMGGQYIIEGRPRRARFDDADQNVGLIYAELPFVPAHPGAYLAGDDAGWQAATLGIVPAQVGGIKSPLRAPLRTSMESSRAAPIEMSGDVEAWPIIEIHGPMQSNAQVEAVGRWRVYLNRALAYDQVVTIDTRPGRRATRLDGQARMVLDPRSSLISELSLLPGRNVIALRGASIEGTAKVSIRWRNTKGSI